MSTFFLKKHSKLDVALGTMLYKLTDYYYHQHYCWAAGLALDHFFLIRAACRFFSISSCEHFLLEKDA